jgi:hypothetical protein
MRPDEMVPGYEHENVQTEGYRYEKMQPVFLLSLIKEEEDKKGQRREYDRPQEDQAVIIRQLVDLVGNHLEEPEIIHPFAGRLDKRKIAVFWDRAILKEISPAVQVVPQIGINAHDRPLEETVKDEKEK